MFSDESNIIWRKITLAKTKCQIKLFDIFSTPEPPQQKKFSSDDVTAQLIISPPTPHNRKFKESFYVAVSAT